MFEVMLKVARARLNGRTAEDISKSTKLLLDESADHYLTIEDVVTVGDVFLRRFSEVLKN